MIQDLALILIVAGIVTLIFKKLKQPLVLGYIVAGFLVSPHMPYIMSVVAKENIQEWADIGVMFLLFSLGLDFSFKKIVKMGMAPIIASMTIVLCMIMLGYTTGAIFGWSNIDCIFLGGMLAMSSTTIIYKAFDDLGLRQQRFASLVMSVLILEDILAIVMMVMLSAIASGNNPDTQQMAMSLLSIIFFLILWFVVGIFAIPLFLRKTRKMMTSETLLIVSLGLCCLMAVVSTKAGFSSAFGAFVMGSILAETVEAEKIEKITEPVKNLFGAIFFVSVGMLVNPNVLVEYALPICAIVMTILLGQAIFGTMGFFLSGQTLNTALRCGFSMAQIGEFAFIIASLGMSMGVIADFLYPVVVAVSVITTFLTPYMIKGADPAYRFIEKRLPPSIILQINELTTRHSNEKSTKKNSFTTQKQLWKKLLKDMVFNSVVYSILVIATTSLMLTFFLTFTQSVLPLPWANGVTGVLTLLIAAPFMRAIIMKKNHSEEWQQLWQASPVNRLPLISTVVARGALCMIFIFYICNYLAHFTNALLICLCVIIITAIILSRSIKQRSIRMERLFKQNLRSREVAAQVKGQELPTYANTLVERDLTLAEVSIPENSLWAGKTLADLQLGKNFGVHVSSILRNGRRINIPYGVEQIFYNDKLQVIGSDEQITNLCKVIENAVHPDETDNYEERETILRQIVIGRNSPILGKQLCSSRLREDFALLVVGIEEGQQNLTSIDPKHVFQQGDIVWLVGERSSFEKFE